MLSVGGACVGTAQVRCCNAVLLDAPAAGVGGCVGVGVGGDARAGADAGVDVDAFVLVCIGRGAHGECGGVGSLCGYCAQGSPAFLIF